MGGRGQWGPAGRPDVSTTRLEPSEKEKVLTSYLAAIGPGMMDYILKGQKQYPMVTPQETSQLMASNAKAGIGMGNVKGLNLGIYGKTMRPSSDIMELAFKLFGGSKFGNIDVGGGD